MALITRKKGQFGGLMALPLCYSHCTKNRIREALL